MAAHTARTLRPEDEIARYRIVGPLGAGGMGEVYLAQDRTLGRNVALKILPPEVVRSEERVRRFELEARSASSLSHPNIVTIHEIGHDVVRSAGAAESSPVHYISMELVSGKTLTSLIHEEKADLRALVGWLAQAADGIAKAHAAGIVHRDLKPGNIMVTADGFAKVLDFGLAKLTETGASDPEATNEPTLGRDATDEGRAVGTAGYMSPEQVQGRSVDHRSDIFSFGCILYEAATRRRAFAAESSIETMHKVLHETPAPVEGLNPKVPAELRRLIRRCLQKSPEQRLQSMKDLALELREIEAEYETLSPSGSSGSQSAALGTPAQRSHRLLWAATGVSVAAVIAIAWWAVQRGRPATEAFQRMRMTTVTSSGDVSDAVLSSDGRYLAYISERAGHASLRVRQVATGSDVEVVPPGEARLANPSFSPDGNYLYYTSPQPERQYYNVLYQVPSLGGPPREVAFDADSRASFSPDGKQLAFRRHVVESAEDRLVVVDLGSRKERVLARIGEPLSSDGSPAWSPDGRRIAVILIEAGAYLRSTVALFDARTGRRQDWTALERTHLLSLAWLRGGSALVAGAQVPARSIYEQLLLLDYPGGRQSFVTNDFNNYAHVSASYADEAIAAVRLSLTVNVWLADADGGSARRITSATGPENTLAGASAADTGTIVCDGPRGGVMQVWALGAAGGAPRTLTDSELHSFGALTAGGVIAFQRLDATGVHVWAMNADGSAPRQLTHGQGEFLADLSRDGRFVSTTHMDSTRLCSVVSTADGAVRLRLDDVAGGGLFSPDSRLMAVARPEKDEKGLTAFRVDAVPLEGGPVAANLHLPANATGQHWLADGSGVSYLDRSDAGSNVFRQSPGGAPVRVTNVSAGRVLRHEWSPDGRRLAYLVRSGAQVDLWVADAGGRHEKQVTRISPETIIAFRWMPDSRRLVVEAASRSSDVALIRNFR